MEAPPSGTAGQNTRPLDAHLVRGAQRLEVICERASRLTLTVSLVGEPTPAAPADFDGLEVQLEGGPYTLTRCRLDWHRRLLTFLDDVYDCHALIDQRRIVNLGGFLEKLSLVLAQKADVPRAFKERVADWRYDLAVYKRFLDEQDRVYAAEEPAVAAWAQSVLLGKEAAGFKRSFDSQLRELEAVVGPLSKEVYALCGTYLRRLMWDFILGSEFLKRTNLKPRGYAGDAEMMCMLYDRQYVGRYSFNKLMHRHPLDTPAAQAVRNRRQLIAGEMRSLQAARAGTGGRLKFFSVACGPAWELRDLFRTEADARAFSGVLLDQDPAALSVAQKTAEDIGKALGAPLELEYVSDSVRTLLRARARPAPFGPFDFIYSMGLFDYLNQPVARAVLSQLYAMLAPGGVLLAGNYHRDHPTRHYMAFWMDWVLCVRSEAELSELADGLEGAHATVGFEDTRCQMFLRVERRR